LSKWQWKKVWFFRLPFKYYYDNEFKDEFDFRKWVGRFGWTIAIFKATNSVELNLIDKVFYASYLLANTLNKNKGSTSGRRLRYISLRVMHAVDSPMINWAINYWGNFILKLYPGKGLQGIFEIYDGKAHPFAIYGKTKYQVPPRPLESPK